MGAATTAPVVSATRTSVPGVGHRCVEGDRPHRAASRAEESVREPRRVAPVAHGPRPSHGIVLVDRVVVAPGLDPVEHRRLAGESGVVVGDPEVPLEAPLRPPAVLDEEGAVARRTPEEPARRVVVVPADDGHVMGELRRGRVVRFGRAVEGPALVGHRCRDRATRRDRPLQRTVVAGPAPRRQVVHVLDMTHSPQPLRRLPGARIAVVALEHRAFPACDIGAGDTVRGATLIVEE